MRNATSINSAAATNHASPAWPKRSHPCATAYAIGTTNIRYDMDPISWRFTRIASFGSSSGIS